MAAVGGDEALWQRVREDLIFNDPARDKDGAGLLYIGPVAALGRSV